MRTSYTIDEMIESGRQKFKDKKLFTDFMMKNELFHKSFDDAKKKNESLTIEEYIDDFFKKTQEIGKMTGII